MSLSAEQKNAVAKWFAAGEGLAEIQKRISSEFGIDLTYLDVRLLVADLPQPSEPEPPETVESSESPEAQGERDIPGPPESPDVPEQPGIPDDPENAETPAGGELSVAVDPLAPPGAIACGSVVFSDGNTGKWVLDQMGRLGLSGLPEGYRPSPEDGAQFQPKLLAALRAKGLV